MPFDAGDIADLYEWSDENSERGNGSPSYLEESRERTKATAFEQLLERELAKQRDLDSVVERRAEGGTKPRQTFLKKGARGWWMRNPEAKQKMQKHILSSVDPDELSNDGQKKKSHRQEPQPPIKGRRVEQNNSPQRSPPIERKKPTMSPAKHSPIRTREESIQPSHDSPSLPIWARSNAQIRTNESVETLGMSGVRQDYVARIEREADELADFEALERELAAEKEAYIHEKRLSQVDEDYLFTLNGEASWFRESTDDEASLHGDSFHVAASPIQSRHSSLDLGGESSMVFDNVNVFRSPVLQQSRPARSQRRDQRSRPSIAPSELSAVSFNDSEPWDDGKSAQHHFSRLPESPISQRDNPYLVESRTDHHGATFDEDEGFRSDDEVPERGSANGLTRRGEAPVSSLVRQVFGQGTNYESEEDESDAYSQPPLSQAMSRIPPNDASTVKSTRASGANPRSRPPATKVAPPNNRASRRDPEATDESHKPPRRKSPGFTSNGMLPVAVEEKLAELEEEVRFYKSETLQLQKRKSHFEGELQKLSKAKEEFARYQEDQRRLIENEWERERQKMKKEEKMFERQVKLKLSAAASAASRKDRNEIDALKAQIVKLQLDAKQSASKAKTSSDALRLRISELEGKNREMSEEIKFLERDRLDQWQKYEILLKELNATKQNQRDGASADLRTISDVARVGRSAEQLLQSVGLTVKLDEQSVRHSVSKNNPTSIASTPTYSNGRAYNPGRYHDEEAESPDQAHNVTHTNGLEQEESASRPPVQSPEITGEVTHPGGKKEVTYRDGTKRIYFADGNEKEILPNGTVVIRFTNGDRKEYFPDSGVSVYHYFEAQTKLTTYPDKTKVYEFPNDQVEKSFPDGTTEITFADGIKKVIHPNGDEFSTFPDGTTMLESTDGTREVTLLNGKRVRYYTDGRMGLINPDGEESEIRSDEELRELMETL